MSSETDARDAELRATPRPEREGVPALKAFLVLTGTLAIFALAVALTMWIRTRWQAHSPAAGIPSQVGTEEIGIVYQPVFQLEVKARDQRAKERRLLETYGWVDRPHGRIRIPLQRAFERLVAEDAAGGGR